MLLAIVTYEIRIPSCRVVWLPTGIAYIRMLVFNQDNTARRLPTRSQTES